MSRSVDVSTEVEIARPRSQVAAYASNPGNATTWYANIKSVERQTPGPLGLGSRFAFVANFVGRRLAYTYEVMEIVPAERFVMATLDGPFPMETTYAWRDMPNGTTRMTLRNRGEPSGFSRFATPFIATSIRHANRKDLARLKDLLERGPSLE